MFFYTDFFHDFFYLCYFRFLKYEYDTPMYSFWHLFCLVASELSGSVIWCQTLIWGKLLVMIASGLASVPFTPAPGGPISLALARSSRVFCSVPCSLFSLPCSFDGFCRQILKLSSSYLSRIQSPDEPTRDFILHLCQCFLVSGISFDS